MSKEDHIVTLAICLPKSHQSIAAALYLPKEVYEKNNCLQILTYQRLSGYIVDSIANPKTKESESEEKKIQPDEKKKETNPRYRKLRPFGMIEYGFDQVLDDDTAARMVG